MVRRTLAPVALALTACLGDVSQVAGTGAVYATRCAADMLPAEDGTYTARCAPPKCADGYEEVALNHVADALDPGRKVIGHAERVCLQDLARASGLFNPALMPPAPPPQDAAPAN
jgi:hypothetical protein